MKLEWLEDLLAVIDTGSLYEASKKRFLTQPAFSRRIRTIEHYVGAELFDRDRKPLRLKASVTANEANIRQLAQSLRNLSAELKRGDTADPLLVLACQHAISTAVAPQLVGELSGYTESRIKLRSANRDECFEHLLTGKADIALTYQTTNETLEDRSDFVESIVVGRDEFIPVISRSLAKSAARFARQPGLDVIRYPDDVFLGRLFSQAIMPDLIDKRQIRWIAETGLTTAALQFALTGVGVAWVPHSLAKDHLANNNLINLGKVLPRVSIDICALRLTSGSARLTGTVWSWLLANELPVASLSKP